MENMQDVLDDLSCYGLETVIVEGGVPNTVFVADLKAVTLSDGRHSFVCKQPQVDRFVNVDSDQTRHWKRDVRDCYLEDPVDAETLCEGKAKIEVVGYYDYTDKVRYPVTANLPVGHEIVGLFKAKMITFEYISQNEIAEFLVQHYEYHNYKIEFHAMSLRGYMFALRRGSEPAKVFAKSVDKIHQVDDLLSDQDKAKLIVRACVNTFVASRYNVKLDATDVAKVTRFRFENWEHPWSTNSYRELRIAETCGLMDVHRVYDVDYVMLYPEYMGLIASKCSQEEIQSMLDYASKINEEANQKMAAKVRKGKASIEMLVAK